MFSWYYIEGILIQSCYTLLIVLGLSILTGYTGMFSFGHAGFVCIGAYVSILCTMAFGLPYWLSLIIAGLAAMPLPGREPGQIAPGKAGPLLPGLLRLPVLDGGGHQRGQGRGGAVGV